MDITTNHHLLQIFSNLRAVLVTKDDQHLLRWLSPEENNIFLVLI